VCTVDSRYLTEGRWVENEWGKWDTGDKIPDTGYLGDLSCFRLTETKRRKVRMNRRSR